MSVTQTDIVYKYCSAETAQQILSSRTLRWSAPYLLRDPTEPTHLTRLHFSSGALINGAIKSATAMIFSRDVPRGNSPLVTAIRRWREEDRFQSPEEAEGVLRELLAQMVDQRQEAINKIMSDWQVFTRRLRICSFCARWDNLVAWQLFAANHTGVALKFELQEAKSFGDAQAINYGSERPAITTVKEQLGIIINNERHIAQEHFLDKFRRKAGDFNKQQEVRCFYNLSDGDPAPGDDPAQWFLDREFEEDSLKAVYFGLNTSLQDKQNVWDSVKDNFTLVKIHGVKMLPGKYEIEAERLTEKPA